MLCLDSSSFLSLLPVLRVWVTSATGSHHIMCHFTTVTESTKTWTTDLRPPKSWVNWNRCSSKKPSCWFGHNENKTDIEANSLTEPCLFITRKCVVWHDSVWTQPLLLSGLFCYLSSLPNSLIFYAAPKGDRSEPALLKEFPSPTHTPIGAKSRAFHLCAKWLTAVRVIPIRQKQEVLPTLWKTLSQQIVWLEIDQKVKVIVCSKRLWG